MNKKTCSTCVFYRKCSFNCNNYIERKTILERMYLLLQDKELHTYEDIAEKVWQCKLDHYLLRNIRTQKNRLQKEYNLVIKTRSNVGLTLIGERNVDNDR